MILVIKSKSKSFWKTEIQNQNQVLGEVQNQNQNQFLAKGQNQNQSKSKFSKVINYTMNSIVPYCFEMRALRAFGRIQIDVFGIDLLRF